MHSEDSVYKQVEKIKGTICNYTGWGFGLNCDGWVWIFECLLVCHCYILLVVLEEIVIANLTVPHQSLSFWDFSDTFISYTASTFSSSLMGHFLPWVLNLSFLRAPSLALIWGSPFSWWLPSLTTTMALSYFICCSPNFKLRWFLITTLTPLSQLNAC